MHPYDEGDEGEFRELSNVIDNASSKTVVNDLNVEQSSSSSGCNNFYNCNETFNIQKNVSGKRNNSFNDISQSQ